MREEFRLKNIRQKLAQCLRDDRGIAMTEYMIITGIVLPMVFYLFHPDNTFYYGARLHFDTVALLMSYPGP